MLSSRYRSSLWLTRCRPPCRRTVRKLRARAEAYAEVLAGPGTGGIGPGRRRPAWPGVREGASPIEAGDADESAPPSGPPEHGPGSRPNLWPDWRRRPRARAWQPHIQPYARQAPPLALGVADEGASDSRKIARGTTAAGLAVSRPRVEIQAYVKK